MAKKELGSVTRTIGSAIAGAFIYKAVNEYGLTIDTLELILKHTDTLIAVLGLLSVQGWSFLEKNKKHKEIKTLKEKVNQYENLNR